MIRRIRKHHKIVWLILAILLPTLFVTSIVFRHIEPVNEKIPKPGSETPRAAERSAVKTPAAAEPLR